MGSQLVTRPVVPPTPELADFSASLQQNFEEIFGIAHNHPVKTAAPASTDGTVGDSMGVVVGSTYKFYFKFPTGWKSVTLI